MTTVREIHCEEIYLKGEPIQTGGGTINNIEFNNIQNDMTEINAVIAGLTGGQPPTDVRHEPLIQTRPPTNQDDINENWHVGSIWVAKLPSGTSGGWETVNVGEITPINIIYSYFAYVCVDNAELNAKWKVCSVEIKDDVIGVGTTYSSHKIVDEFKKQSDSFDYLLTLKANVSDMNIALSGKANASAMTLALNGKADKSNTYTKSEINSYLNLKADKSTTYTKTETDTIINNIPTSYTKTEINNYLNLKADKSATYTKTETDTIINNLPTSYTKTEINNYLNLKADKSTTYTKTETNDLVNTLASLVSTTKADVNNVYTKTETNNLVNTKADANNVYTKTETDNLVNTNAPQLQTIVSVILNMMTQFPPIPLDYENALSSVTPYGIVKASSKLNSNAPTYAFDTIFNNSWWSSANFPGGNNIGYHATLVNGTYQGRQWLQIDCQSNKTFKGFQLQVLTNDTNTRPKEYHIAGSVDGTNFYSLFYTNNETYEFNTVSHLFSNQYSYYRYLRLVIKDITATDTVQRSVHISELKFFQ